MAADQAGAIALYNNNYYPNRDGQKPRYIILHSTAGGTSATAIANYFASTQNTSSPVSSHYIIGTDGAVAQTVAEKNAAWGNGIISAGHDPWWSASVNPNDITISIEHCKPSLDNSDALTAKQQAASFKLISDICNRWSIPRRAADATGGITGHYSIDPVSRSNCPGPYPWDALWAYLAPIAHISLEDSGVFGISSSDFKNYWTVQGEHWNCPRTGYNMGGAVRQFYCDLSIDGQSLPLPGLPQSNEIKVGTSGEVVQKFERMTLCYNPTLKAFPPGSRYNVYILMLSDPLTK